VACVALWRRVPGSLVGGGHGLQGQSVWRPVPRSVNGVLAPAEKSLGSRVGSLSVPLRRLVV